MRHIILDDAGAVAAVAASLAFLPHGDDTKNNNNNKGNNNSANNSSSNGGNTFKFIFEIDESCVRSVRLWLVCERDTAHRSDRDANRKRERERGSRIEKETEQAGHKIHDEI